MTTKPSTMPPSLPPLTLVVATTPSLGIGRRGTLPWPPLKSDLAFFARVTKRVPPAQTSYNANSNAPRMAKNIKNAVLMGRKTWESIPPKFRPLKGRINVIVSRRPQELDLPSVEDSQEPVLAVGSIEEGLRKMQSTYPITGPHDEQLHQDETCRAGGEASVELGRVFVIGGAEIYGHALQMPECERILWTRLKGEWDCDTYFPKGALWTEGAGDDDDSGDGQKWILKSGHEMEEWTGEKGIGGPKRESEVEYEMCMLEKDVTGVDDWED